ncbi:MAG: ABC transporter permease, partial [Gemmatimonadetes bacterium]|nr:ABC transporter permease [Gemmatimonadota bacterium]
MKGLRAPGTRLALATLVGVAAFALLAWWLAPDPNAITDPVGGRLLGPSGAHWLGTDALSRDLLARLARGGAISLTIGLSAALCSGILGGLLGMSAGAAGGWADVLLMRGIDALGTIPRAFVLLFAA